MATLTIRGNTFTPRSPSVSIVGQVNAEQVTFVVDESWSGLELQAQFSNTSINREPVPVALDETMTCYVPSEATAQPGKVYVALAGYDAGVQIKLTELLHYSNAKSGADPNGGVPPEDQTPSYLNQIKQILNETKSVAQSVRTDADNGLFDGEPGKSPIIKDRTWWIWSVEDQAYKDTGILASGGGVSSYNDLSDRPTIGGVLLEGNKTAQDLGLQPKGDYATTSSKLANPFSITFTGAVEAAYDGSKAVTVTIPTIAGPPGVSPTVATEEIDGGTRVTFTFKGGSETVDILDGKTPAKGVDYFTEEEKKEIAEQAAALVPGGGAIDDETISAGSTWSSRMIVDSLAPEFEVSGAIVTCNPVTNYPLNVVSQIVSAQDGEGDPSPENVRPISGWDSVSVRITGVNLWDNNADSAIVEEYPSGNGYLGFPLKLKPNANYTLYIPKNTRGSSNITLTTEERQNNSPKDELYINLSGTELFIDGYKKIRTGKTGYVFINVSSRTKDQFWKGLRETVPQLMIYEGADEIPYEPYAGKTVTSQLGQTIYGGTLDWMTGELTVTHICADIKSTDAWGDSIAVNGYILNKDFGIAEGGAVLCNIAPVSGYGGAGALTASVVYGYVRMSDFKTLFPTIEEWRGFLDETGGVQIVGRLKTPTTVKLTPTEILALTGTNTIYTDTGDTTVSGRADPNATIKDLLSRIDALEKAAIGGA